MKKRVLVSILILVMTTAMFAGCGKKEVDYGMDGDTEQNSENSGTSESELLEFKTVDTWTDEWSITDETGHERTVKVDADVIMPEVDKLSIVEVEQQPFDEAFRKQFLSALYENGEIYYNDEIHYTKQEYEDRIAMLEDTDGVDAETQEYWQELVEEYEKMLETAPDEYVEAEDYLSSDEFLGYVGDVTCKVEFREAVDCIFALPDTNDKTYWPEVLRDYESAYTLQPEDAGSMQDVTNSCKLSMEEARRLADAFLGKIGRGGQLCTGENNLVWKGENYDSVGKVTDYEYTVNGYSFTYGTGIDHMAFSQFPDFMNFDFAWQEGFDSANYNNGDSIEIVVTDAGVTEVYIEEPLNICKVYDPVDIVQPDTVKGIIKEEVMENTQRYSFAYGGTGNGVEFNSLSLLYMKLPDETQEGVYTYVPVWCAANAIDGEVYTHAVFVNAIDGGIIYMDEVYKCNTDGEGITEDTGEM